MPISEKEVGSRGGGHGGTVIIVPRPIPMNEVPKGPPLVRVDDFEPGEQQPGRHIEAEINAFDHAGRYLPRGAGNLAIACFEGAQLRLIGKLPKRAVYRLVSDDDSAGCADERQHQGE